MSALTLADPQAVTMAAGALAAIAGQLDDDAQRVTRAACAVMTGWRGSASLAAAAKAAQVQAGMSVAAVRLREVSSAAHRHAAQVSAAHDQAAAERAAVPAEFRMTALVSPPPDPSALALRTALIRADPYAGFPADLPAIRDGYQGLTEVADLGTSAKGALLPTVSLVGAARAAQVAARSSDEVAAAAAQLRVSAAVSKLGGGPLALREALASPSAANQLIKGVRGKVTLAGTVVEGMHDVVAGEPDHPGWRDATTRIMGGAGAAGGGVILSGLVANPIGLGVAAGAVTGYGLWKLGTAIYDNWDSIVGGAQAAGRVGLRVVANASMALNRGREAVAAAATRLREAADRARESIKTKARESAAAVAERAEAAVTAVADGARQAGSALAEGAREAGSVISDRAREAGSSLLELSRKGIDAIHPNPSAIADPAFAGTN